jgi:hypothetical protein
MYEMCKLQAIGDRTGVPSSLVRGEFNRAWNELALSEESEVIRMLILSTEANKITKICVS